MESDSHIDVVLPVYNGSKYLRASIDSVLAQQEISFHLYIIDDCSSDNSWEIISEYKDLRISASRNSSNQGLFRTLNKLMSQGKGQLIKIWAQDDVMKSNCLKSFYTYFMKYDFRLAFSNCSHIDDHGNIIEYGLVDETPVNITPEYFRDICIFNGSISSNISNVAISRITLSEVGSFNDNMIASGDHELWTRIGLKAGAIRIPDELMFIRVHANQLSRSNKTAAAFALEDFEVVKMLWNSCTTQKQAAIARNYYIKIILPYHLNTMLKLLATGNFSHSLKMFSFVASKRNIFVAMMDFFRMKILKWYRGWDLYRHTFIEDYNA